MAVVVAWWQSRHWSWLRREVVAACGRGCGVWWVCGGCGARWSRCVVVVMVVASGGVTALVVVVAW